MYKEACYECGRIFMVPEKGCLCPNCESEQTSNYHLEECECEDCLNGKLGSNVQLLSSISKPKQLPDLDTEKLRKMCQEYIDCTTRNVGDRNATHFIFEVAMETVFGKDVWKYVNANLI